LLFVSRRDERNGSIFHRMDGPGLTDSKNKWAAIVDPVGFRSTR